MQCCNIMNPSSVMHSARCPDKRSSLSGNTFNSSLNRKQFILPYVAVLHSHSCTKCLPTKIIISIAKAFSTLWTACRTIAFGMEKLPVVNQSNRITSVTTIASDICFWFCSFSSTHIGMWRYVLFGRCTRLEEASEWHAIANCTKDQSIGMSCSLFVYVCTLYTMSLPDQNDLVSSTIR